MKFIAPAKINLNLHVTGRRDDGYHFIQSDMVFTKWGDEITIQPSDDLYLTVDGQYAHVFTKDLLSTDRSSANLIVRAAYMMADKGGFDPNFHIHVTKKIPSGAGLGGGSSDAAVIMRTLNDYWGMGLSVDELCAMGLSLGAELPVCLWAVPSRVTGIGEIIEAIDVRKHNILIVWPDKNLVTKDVFQEFAISPEVHEVNDLTGAAIRLCPEIESILSDLTQCDGCIEAMMSGSGSACFGIFETIEQAEKSQSKFINSVATSTGSIK